MNDPSLGDETIFIQRRAAQLNAEIERMRGRELADAPMVIRASEIVAVREAADVLESYGHRVIASVLRRFSERLRNLP